MQWLIRDCLQIVLYKTVPFAALAKRQQATAPANPDPWSGPPVNTRHPRFLTALYPGKKNNPRKREMSDPLNIQLNNILS